MDFNGEFNKEAVMQAYSSNKELVVPIITIIVSISLFLFIVFPQMLSFPSNKAQADQETIKLDKMQAAYELLAEVDGGAVDANLKIAQKTLPDKKDFESVLNAISVASGNSSTQIIDYTYSAVGGSTNKYPTLNFKIQTLGGVKESINFINELYKVYPLSDVISFTSSNDASKIDVNFYYRAFPPITSDDRTTVTKMSEEQESALKVISEWKDTDTGFEIIPEASSSSSTTPF